MRPDRIVTTDGVVASMPHALWDEHKARAAELEAIIRAILDADERGEGQPFAEAMERAHKAVAR